MTNIEYWLTSSKDDLDTADKLFVAKKYHHCLFFVHLALEKVLKAVYASRKHQAPPLVHDLVRLAQKSDLEIGESLTFQLVEISTFNVAARYDDYRFKFYKKATREYANRWLKAGKELYKYFSDQV